MRRPLASTTPNVRFRLRRSPDGHATTDFPHRPLGRPEDGLLAHEVGAASVADFGRCSTASKETPRLHN